MSADISLRAILDRNIEHIKRQMPSRCYRGAHKLRNAAVKILGQQGGGRRYYVPGTSRLYTASAPGEPPAARTGTFKNSWQPKVICDGASFISRIESNVNVNGHNLGELLENGTSRMAPRPHHDRIKQQALPEIVRIYSEPYF